MTVARTTISIRPPSGQDPGPVAGGDDGSAVDDDRGLPRPAPLKAGLDSCVERDAERVAGGRLELPADLVGGGRRAGRLGIEPVLVEQVEVLRRRRYGDRPVEAAGMADLERPRSCQSGPAHLAVGD